MTRRLTPAPMRVYNFAHGVMMRMATWRAATIDVRAWWAEAARRLIEAFRPRVTPLAAAKPESLVPLARLRLTDEVSRTLFAEYAEHRAGDRGDEEIGWLLLGHRDGDTATALATLPAGAERQAGQAHVQFNSTAQALASRIVRQQDKRLTLLGVVHTHPGSLRHPSDGDFRGDSRWVSQLRGKEGVFGIGTADAPDDPEVGVAWQPTPARQCLDGLSWCWYVLAEGDRQYRPIPVEIVLGPDLAQELRPVWDVIEAHAARLDALARQLARIRFEVAAPATLVVDVPLARPDSAIRVGLTGKEVRYVLLRGGQAMVADLPEPRVDQGVYLLLAELAAQESPEGE